MVIGVNLVVLTVFLWHLTAVILLIGVLDAAGTLPTPAVDSAAWWAWRLPWLLLLTVVLAVLVAIFGPVEARSGRHRTGWAALGPVPGGVDRRRIRRGGGRAADQQHRTAARAPEPLGTPVPALAGVPAGAGVLRLLRSGWGSRG